LPINHSIKHLLTMKAIINIKRKSSGYSYLNGHTFEVKQVLSNLIALQIPSQICEGKFDTCDFSFDEVIIVNIDEEVQSEYNQYCWDGKGCYNNLRYYCIANRIKTNEVMNCPA